MRRLARRLYARWLGLPWWSRPLAALALLALAWWLLWPTGAAVVALLGVANALNDRRSRRDPIVRAAGDAAERRGTEARVDAERVASEAAAAPARHEAEDAAVTEAATEAGERERAAHDRDRHEWWRDRRLP